LRRLLSGMLGVGLVVGASAGAALAAPRGGGDAEELTYEDTIELAFEDVQAFWDETLPDAYGTPYRELRDDQFIAYDEDTPRSQLPACGEEDVSYDDIAENAFYCVLGAEAGDDFVAFDDGGLFPRLFEDFGPFALVQVLAHEWGHAIQGQVYDFDTFVSTPTIQKELQADCYAGAYVDWVDEGNSEVGFVLDPGDIETGLAGLLEFRDPLGTDPTQQGAHGNGFDRTNAFSEGIEQGALRCVQYDDASRMPPVTEIAFSTEQDFLNEGDLPLNEAIDAGVADLDFYWEEVFAANNLRYPSVDDVDGYDPRRRSQLPECEALNLDPKRAKRYREQVFYCPGEGYIAYDENLIEDVHGQIGDFGAMLLIGNAWASAMQEELELAGEALQADCFTGAWAGSIPLDLDGDGFGDFAARGTEVIRDPDFGNAEIFLSPGDLDEVVIAFLAFSESATERGQELTAFERLASFRGGFFSITAEEDCAAVEE
jgi:predicted metalloprotease